MGPDSVAPAAPPTRLFYALLHAVLLTRFDAPLALLELGCGDASQTLRAFTEVRLRRYIGVDLSAAALALARENLARADIAAELRQESFATAVPALAERFVAVLASYSLHHLRGGEKGDMLAAIRARLNPHGVFVLIDVVRRDAESREGRAERRSATSPRCRWRRC